MTTLLLRNALLPSGTTTDVRCEGGLITGFDDDGRASETVELNGMLLLPAPAEPHAHLDKALLAERFPNHAGDLDGAIDAVRRAYRSMTIEDVFDRAMRSARDAIANGSTALRSHADCGADVGTRSVAALAQLRERLRGSADVQLVALAGFPSTGRAGAANRRALEQALELGVDAVGGIPSHEDDPVLAVDELARLAAESGLALDLHVDETLDRRVRTIEAVSDAVGRHGLGGRATASHCVSLGTQEPAIQHRIAGTLAGAGVAVVCLPQTNLYLQGRGSTARPRGLTALDALHAAGATVAAGGDNWRDPFNPLGRMDPYETASLLVAAGHLTPEAAFEAVTTQARSIMNLPATRLAPGYPADLVAIRARDTREAIAAGPPDRIVFHRGTLVSTTETVRHFYGTLA